MRTYNWVWSGTVSSWTAKSTAVVVGGGFGALVMHSGSAAPRVLPFLALGTLVGVRSIDSP